MQPDRIEAFAKRIGEFDGAQARGSANGASTWNSAAAAGDKTPYPIVDGAAIIAMGGVMTNRATAYDDYFGVTSCESLGAKLRAAMADAKVDRIVLDVDSPGGEAAGAMELAATVRAAARIKPVVALANSLMASAAYAVGAGASEVVVTPSAMVGSIGVVWAHMDYSRLLVSAGVKPTLLTAGDFKKDGNSLEPLAPDARARIEKMINAYYELFVESVGVHRPRLGASGARRTQAGVFVGRHAIDAGLADRVGDLESILAKR
jgi:signal peptide peptidase SppA